MFLDDFKLCISVALPGTTFEAKDNKLYFRNQTKIFEDAKITDCSNYVFLDKLQVNKGRAGTGSVVLKCVIDSCEKNNIRSIECRPVTSSGKQFCNKNNFHEVGTTGLWAKII